MTCLLVFFFCLNDRPDICFDSLLKTKKKLLLRQSIALTGVTEGPEYTSINNYVEPSLPFNDVRRSSKIKSV